MQLICTNRLLINKDKSTSSVYYTQTMGVKYTGYMYIAGGVFCLGSCLILASPKSVLMVLLDLGLESHQKCLHTLSNIVYICYHKKIQVYHKIILEPHKRNPQFVQLSSIDHILSGTCSCLGVTQ